MRLHSQAAAWAALALPLLSSPMAALAGPADQVYSPIVVERERELEFKAGTLKQRDGTRLDAQSLSLGWGVTSWWFTELAAKWHKEPGQNHGFDAWEWENRFQLLETGSHAFELGLLLEIERPSARSEGYELRWGPLLQVDFSDKLQGNLNLLVEKHYRSSEPSPAELGYQWQLKWRAQPAFEFGAQGLGALGPWRHWQPRAEQTHLAGPALFGRVRLAPGTALKYSAGLLFGLNQSSPRTQLRWLAEFEF